jgi:hypothetical protein
MTDGQSAFRKPEAVQITVFIDHNRAIGVIKGEISYRVFPWMQPFSLHHIILRHKNPLDVMLWLHRVFNRTDLNPQFITIALKGGHVLFTGTITGIGHKQFHIFIAAHGVYPTVLDDTEQVAADVTTVKFPGFHDEPSLYVFSESIVISNYSHHITPGEPPQ